jgi:hypothetical protein
MSKFSKPGYIIFNIATCIPLSFGELGVPPLDGYDRSMIARFPTKKQALAAGKVYLSNNSQARDSCNHPLIIGREYNLDDLAKLEL